MPAYYSSSPHCPPSIKGTSGRSDLICAAGPNTTLSWQQEQQQQQQEATTASCRLQQQQLSRAYKFSANFSFIARWGTNGTAVDQLQSQLQVGVMKALRLTATDVHSQWNMPNALPLLYRHCPVAQFSAVLETTVLSGARTSTSIGAVINCIAAAHFRFQLLILNSARR